MKTWKDIEEGLGGGVGGGEGEEEGRGGKGLRYDGLAHHQEVTVMALIEHYATVQHWFNKVTVICLFMFNIH